LVGRNEEGEFVCGCLIGCIDEVPHLCWGGVVERAEHRYAGDVPPGEKPAHVVREFTALE
jgi:hypothetical protein